jgi:acyl-CoA synthetase (AMP-forming)/AMP-acid ligase II
MRSGDVINLFSPNSVEFVFAAFGAMAAGCVVTPANVA